MDGLTELIGQVNKTPARGHINVWNALMPNITDSYMKFRFVLMLRMYFGSHDYRAKLLGFIQTFPFA